ncbi:hypothetical protein ACHAPD_002142 [Fusarium lateritium]
MQTTDLPSWLWLPLEDNCEWDSPFNMGNCFDQQYHNVFFVLIEALIYLTRFTTLPLFLFFAGMHGECMATLPMAILSTITIIPMILLRLIWAEDCHTYGGMGNPMVEYSVKTWAILSIPNIVSWAPSAAFMVSQLVRIVGETFISLRIQADSNFDAETLFPAPFAGRDWDSDLGESAEQRRLEQASLLMQKLADENDTAIWKAISRRRPQPIFRRQSALTHWQETELLAEEKGLSKKQFLARRYEVVPVDQSTQSDPTDFTDDRVMKTPVSPIAEIPPSPGVQSDLAESPVLTQVELSEPAPTSSSPPSPSAPSPHETTPKKPVSSPTTTAITPGREKPPRSVSSARGCRGHQPSALSPISWRRWCCILFPSEEEPPPQAIVPFAEPAGLEPTQQPPSPEQAAGSATSFGHEIPWIPDIPEELLFTAANGSEDGREESLHQGLFQPTTCISPSWDPTELDAAIDALLNNVDEVGEQVWDEMAIDNRQAEDVEMEEQGEGEVEVLTSSQAVNCEMEEAAMEPLTEEEQERMIQEASWEALAALLGEDEFCDDPSRMVIDHVVAPTQALSVPQLPLPEFHRPPPPQASIFHFEASRQTVPADYGMSQQEQEDLEMEMEAAFDTEMEDARDEEEVGMGPQAPVEEIRPRRILVPRAQGSRHNPSQPPTQPTPTPSTTTKEVESQSKRARPPSTEQMAPEPKRAQHVPIHPSSPPTTPTPTNASPKRQPNNQHTTTSAHTSGSSPSTTITPEQKAAFEKKKQAQIKAQQEARRSKKPNLFHQSKKPATPVHPSPNTPHRQGTPSQPTTPSPMPQIKDGSVKAAAEVTFGTPGSNQKKDGPKIVPGIPSHLRDLVAGRTTEDEE